MLDRFVKKERRRNRIRAKVSGSAGVPRLAVNVTSRHVIAQIIDDQAGKTLVYASDKKKGVTPEKTKTETAFKVGETVADLASKKKIKQVVFDRGGKLYHGRVKAVAEGARSKGLEL